LGVARLDLTPLAVSLSPGAEAAIRVTGRDTAGDSMPGASVVWESSNPRVATVSPDGVVRGVGPGVAQLTARSGASSAAAVVTVTAPAQRSRLPERVTVVPSAPAPQPAETTARQQAAPVAAPVAAPPVVPAAPAPARDTVVARDTPRVNLEPPPPSPRPVDPRPEIERTLENYRRAIESRDLSRLKAAYPGLTAEQEEAWQGFFGNVTQLTATLSVQDLQVSGDRAQATLSGTYAFHSGSRQVQRVELVAGLERGPDGWRLVSIK
jgi:hypothetical protein